VQGPDESAQNLKVYPARKFPSRLRVLDSHNPDLGLSSRMRWVVGLERSAEYLFMVELYPSWQSQSRHDWPRPLPRAWSSARYAKPGASPIAHSSDATGLTAFFFVIDPPPFAPGCPTGLCFSVPHGVPAPPSLKNVKPSLSLSILHPPSHTPSILFPMTAVTHLWWARLRFMRKSRPNIQTSSPRSTGA
jgi:hypothetical protein